MYVLPTYTCSANCFLKFTATYGLWKDINNFTVNILSDVTIFYRNIIFGCCVYSNKDGSAFFLINLILLLAKFHIHKCKCTKN